MLTRVKAQLCSSIVVFNSFIYPTGEKGTKKEKKKREKEKGKKKKRNVYPAGEEGTRRRRSPLGEKGQK